MSEQALQGQLMQGSGLQSCWGKQKTDALQDIWHLSFIGASLSGDHSAALQPGPCKSDCAVLPWWVTTPGQSSFKLTPEQRSQAKGALPALHSTAQSPCHGPVLVLRARGFLFPITSVMPVRKPAAGLAGVCDLTQRKRGAHLREGCDGGELTVSLSSLGSGMAGAGLAPDPALSRRGCSCRSSSVCAVLVQLIAALRTCLHGKIYQPNYPTVIIPG